MSDDQKLSKAGDDIRAEPVQESANEVASDVWGVSYGDEDDRELTVQQIEEALSTGEIGPRTLVWRPGMAAWRPLETVEKLSGLLASKPKAKAGLEQRRPATDESKRARSEPRTRKNGA